MPKTLGSAVCTAFKFAPQFALPDNKDFPDMSPVGSVLIEIGNPHLIASNLGAKIPQNHFAVGKTKARPVLSVLCCPVVVNHWLWKPVPRPGLARPR